MGLGYPYQPPQDSFINFQWSHWSHRSYPTRILLFVSFPVLWWQVWRKANSRHQGRFLYCRGEKKAWRNSYNDPFLPYVDTLLNLQLPEEKRKLEKIKIVPLCSESFTAGTDTTSTALQWILGYLVKYPHIQKKLFVDNKGIIGDIKLEIFFARITRPITSLLSLLALLMESRSRQLGLRKVNCFWVM